MILYPAPTFTDKAFIAIIHRFKLIRNRRINWNWNGKDWTSALFASHANRAAMRFDDSLTYIESNARTGHCLAGAVWAIEFMK